MNSITFRIDKNEYIYSCIYVEKIARDGENAERIVKKIELPQKLLQRYYTYFNLVFKNNKEKIELLDDNYKISFYDVDVDVIDKLIELHNRYEEQQKKLINSDKDINDIYGIFSKKGIDQNTPVSSSDSEVESTSDLTSLNTGEIEQTSDLVTFDEDDKTSDLTSLNEGENEQTSDLVTFDEDDYLSYDSASNDRKKIKRVNKFKQVLVNRIAPILFIMLTLYSGMSIKTSNNETIYEVIEDYFADHTYPTFESIEDEQFENSVINLKTEYNVGDAKYQTVIDNCANYITKYSDMYGLSDELMIAIAAKNGGYNNTRNSINNGYGLYRISSDLVGKKVEAYNFKLGEYQSFLVVNNQYLMDHGGDKNFDERSICNIDNVKDNIRVGCMLYQNKFYDKKFKGNILMGVLAYEVGDDNVLKIVSDASERLHVNKKSLFSQGSIYWLNYRKNIIGNAGDSIESILSYVENNSVISIKKPDGKELSFIFVNTGIKQKGR